MAEYTTELDVNGATIDRAYGKQITSFKIVPGHCIANKNDVLSSRTIESYDKNVLAPLIASGEIGDGTGDSWDDRKVRYDKLELDSSGEARIFMGNSYFQEPGRLDTVSYTHLTLPTK